jgi:hypothetical protein
MALLVLLLALAANPFDQAFWRTWGDGQAELDGYELTYPRYGKTRQGTAVAIFVTEPFSEAARVKADAGKHPAADVFPVMKLNLVEDFQTGIYDYNEMTSSFVALEAKAGHSPGTLVKVSFSSQEWCGAVWAQLLFDPTRARLTSHSYFDGEADQQAELPAPPGGISGDQLMLWARGMAQPWLTPGQSTQVSFLPSLQASRHEHKPLAWSRARLSRGDKVQEITVPAGRFKVDTFKCEIDKGETRTYFVEAAAPHRIIRWESSSGEKAELTGSDRLKYWELNKPGGESYLKRLGLKPRPARTT